MGFGVVGIHHRAGDSNRSLRPGFRTLVPAVSRQRNAPWMESGRACVGHGAVRRQLLTKATEFNLRAISLGSLGLSEVVAVLSCAGVVPVPG